MKKRILIVLAILCFLALCYIIYNQMKPSEYIPAKNEINGYKVGFAE